jgi:U3 small nucleolar RNA-associated protein 25
MGGKRRRYWKPKKSRKSRKVSVDPRTFLQQQKELEKSATRTSFFQPSVFDDEQEDEEEFMRVDETEEGIEEKEKRKPSGNQAIVGERESNYSRLMKLFSSGIETEKRSIVSEDEETAECKKSGKVDAHHTADTAEETQQGQEEGQEEDKLRIISKEEYRSNFAKDIFTEFFYAKDHSLFPKKHQENVDQSSRGHLPSSSSLFGGTFETTQGGAVAQNVLAPCIPETFSSFYACKTLGKLETDPFQSFSQMSKFLMTVAMQGIDLHWASPKWSDHHNELLDCYALYVLNHVLLQRETVRRTAGERKEARETGQDVDFETTRDRGFTRGKVLIVLPFRKYVFSIVQRMIDWMGEGVKVSHHRKFEDKFGPVGNDEEPSSAGGDSDEHARLFSGNCDDCFDFGMSFTRNDKGIRLFQDLLSSDIIFLSPLGSRVLLEKRGGSLDALSSIELCVVDRADVLIMQNIDHLRELIGCLNNIPKETHETDFGRVREIYLDGNGKYVRQTLVFSAIYSEHIQSIWKKTIFNPMGQMQCRPIIAPRPLSLQKKTPQMFRFIPTSLSTMDDVRFKFFCDSVLARIEENGMESHILIVVRSYLELVRIRNHMSSTDVPFTYCTEYSSKPEVTSARSDFYHGVVRVMITTVWKHQFIIIIISLSLSLIQGRLTLPCVEFACRIRNGCNTFIAFDGALFEELCGTHFQIMHLCLRTT